MLTHRGIEANPEKCKAITEMRSPSVLKEIQWLIGRLTSLSRFVPKLAERTRPIINWWRRNSSDGGDLASVRLPFQALHKLVKAWVHLQNDL